MFVLTIVSLIHAYNCLSVWVFGCLCLRVYLFVVQTRESKHYRRNASCDLLHLCLTVGPPYLPYVFNYHQHFKEPVPLKHTDISLLSQQPALHIGFAVTCLCVCTCLCGCTCVCIYVCVGASTKMHVQTRTHTYTQTSTTCHSKTTINNEVITKSYCSINKNSGPPFLIGLR